MNRASIAFGIALGLGTGGGLAHAATINGIFQIDGSMTASLNTITWVDNSDAAEMFVIGPPTPTGSFSAVALNSEGTIENLNLTAEPVGIAFADPDFMVLPSPDGNLSVTLTYIYAGTDGQSECAAAPAAGQQCTPLDANGTPGPFDLQNSSSGQTSSASFTFQGVVTDGNPADNSVINGQFSVNFDTPYQSVLAVLATSGSVSNTYSATFSAEGTATPEPSGILLMLGGLLVGAGLFRKRRLTN